MAYKYPYDDYDTPPAKQYKPERLKTDRKMWKLVLFNVLTLGLYPIFFFIPFSFDLDKVAPKSDRSKTMNFLWAYLLSVFTYSIVLAVWHYHIAVRVEEALDARGVDYEFGTDTYWMWYVFGSFIGVGSYIYLHKLCKAMNLLCEDYNKENFEEKGERK